jgi:hypothetical protein
LADERERTADEQERLADERERLADIVERAAEVPQGHEQTEAWARDQLRRAEAHVQRSLAEHERARAALERIALRDERSRATADRQRTAEAADDLAGEEATWAADRRAFVAAERDSVADRRNVEADRRDELARDRELEADERDTAMRQHEGRMPKGVEVAREGDQGDRHLERAESDLAAVRESARRQRAAADRARRKAAAERAEAQRRRQVRAPDADPYARLATQLTALSNELFSSEDLFTIAGRVADLSTGCIPGAVASGVTLFEGVRPLTHVATDDVATRLDRHQVDEGEGPMALAVELGEPVVVGDLRQEARWPSFRELATELGVAGVVACELAVSRGRAWQSLGALTVYAGVAGALDGDAIDAVALFAAHLSIVAAFDRDRHDVVRREAALHRALGTRDVIGQAKGILMERQHLTAGDAYDVLRRTSQRLNVKLSELSTRLAETGELPD